MTHPTLGADPRLVSLSDATARLTSAGSPFEVVPDVVLGEAVRVFANRPRTLADLLTNTAGLGDRDCYVFSDGRRVSFADLPGRARAVADRLHRVQGLRPGDRVAIAAANGPEWILAFWAAVSSGLVVVAMNGWWTGSEMRNALELTDPSLVLLDERRRERLGDSAFKTALLGPEWDLTPSADSDVSIAMDEDDPALLIFTSGTTGRPKAAVLSHRAVIGYLMLQQFMGARGAMMAGAAAGGGAPPVRLAPYPLFHVSGLSMMGGSVVNGFTTVWPLGRFDPAAVMKLTRDEGVTAWGGGTAHIAKLLDSPDLGSVPPSQITTVGVGGSATSPDIVRRVEAHFPHLKGTMSSGYGSTETGGLATWAPGWMLSVAPDCVGPYLPTVEVRVTDEEGEPVPDGREGNVEIRSPYTMLEYWRHPAATEETIRPGRWVRSGDFGRTEEGVLFIASRKRDLIIRGGENIYPFEIEYRICEHPDVVEAAAFGEADPTYGQKVKAVVVARPGSDLDSESVRSFCADGLAYYKVPDLIEISTDPLPRNASGKVMKHVLSGESASGFADDES